VGITDEDVAINFEVEYAVSETVAEENDQALKVAIGCLIPLFFIISLGQGQKILKVGKKIYFEILKRILGVYIIHYIQYIIYIFGDFFLIFCYQNCVDVLFSKI
jgi:hypothetical protein